MLDQNTDRMWYVIGAVLIGAAIIFGASTMFPSVFASVGNMMGDVIDSIVITGPNVRETDGINLLTRSTGEHMGEFEHLYYEDLTPIIEAHSLDQTYRLTFELKSADISNRNLTYVYMQSGSGSKYGLIGEDINATEEYQSYSYSGLKPVLSEINQARDVPYETAFLSFHGGWSTGNIPIVRNVRLERELR